MDVIIIIFIFKEIWFLILLYKFIAVVKFHIVHTEYEQAEYLWNYT